MELRLVALIAAVNTFAMLSSAKACYLVCRCLFCNQEVVIQLYVSAARKGPHWHQVIFWPRL